MSDSAFAAGRKTGKTWASLEVLMDDLDIPDDLRQAIRDHAQDGPYATRRYAEDAFIGEVLKQQDERFHATASETSEPPHSCPALDHLQSRLRRIREWAEDAGEPKVALWANEAWDEAESVRDINRTLRKQAWGRRRRARDE